MKMTVWFYRHVQFRMDLPVNIVWLVSIAKLVRRNALNVIHLHRVSVDKVVQKNVRLFFVDSQELIKGALKKKLHQQPHKKKGGGSANAPHSARSASDPRARPFFPLSATKALRTTALVLVSQGYGCPTVVQDLSKRVQWRGTVGERPRSRPGRASRTNRPKFRPSSRSGRVSLATRPRSWPFAPATGLDLGRWSHHADLRVHFGWCGNSMRSACLDDGTTSFLGKSACISPFELWRSSVSF